MRPVMRIRETPASILGESWYMEGDDGTVPTVVEEGDAVRRPPTRWRLQMSALVAATMAPIEIVAIHFEANVRIRIGLERTSPRRHHGRSGPADRTVGVGRQLPLQTLKLRGLIS